MEKHIEYVKKIVRTSDFYRRIYGSGVLESKQIDFKKLPTITKQQALGFLSASIKPEMPVGDLITTETSGTTGIPLKITWTRDEYTRSNFYTWKLRLKWYGITPAMKYCTFHSCATDSDRCEKIDALVLNEGRTLSLGRYVYTKEILADYINLINDFDAEWILGPPSVICLLARYMIDNNITLKNIKYIEFNGEFVEENMYELVHKAFTKAKVSNLYGSTEFNGIAFRCPHGKMHILNDNVFVETIEKDGLSLIYITGLVNTLMPLIRYQIGDIGEVETGECFCGYSGPFLNLKRGRVSELIRLKSDLLLDPSAFNNIVHTINKDGQKITQFQIKVKSPTDIEILILLASHECDCEEIEKEILLICDILNSEINYKVRIVYDEIEMYNNNRKFSFVCYEKD